MNPRTPICVCCGDKFPGTHCKKCGFEKGRNRVPGTTKAPKRVGWATHFGNTTSGGTPRVTRKRRKHGVPVR